MTKFAQAAAIVPEPCFIFGTPLRPFSLGHHLLLMRMGLPFAGKPMAPAEMEQIQIGIAICGQTYDETLEQFLTCQWQRVFARWKRDVCGRGFFRRTFSKRVLKEAETLFRAYLQDGYEQPPIWKGGKRENAQVAISVPWPLLLKNRLVMAGYMERDVLNGYLPKLWYDYYSVVEINNARTCTDPAKWRPVFYTEQDAERMEMLSGLNNFDTPQEAAC